MKFHINEDSDFYSLLQSFFHNDLFELHSLDIFEILNLFCAIPGNLMKIWGEVRSLQLLFTSIIHISEKLTLQNVLA